MSNPKPEDFLNLLGNKHRRRIMKLCSIRPLYPQKIAEILGLTPAAVIKHLQELEKSKMIIKKTEPRAEGGRDIQYYYVPFRPRFNFNLANEDLIEIDIVDESDKDVPATPSRKKFLDTESINDEEYNIIKNKFNRFLELEKERIEINNKFKALHERQFALFRKIRSQNPQQQLLFKVFRFLLDRYGFEEEFSERDIIENLGVDEMSAREIIDVLSHKLEIIIPSSGIKQSSSSITMWKIKSSKSKNQMDYM